jgi:hypothetical protein
MLKCIGRFIHNLINRNKSILDFDKKTYGEECPICLEIFGELDDDSLLCTLKCGHSYHKICVNDWLRKDGSCPNCRIEISSNE